MSTRTGTPEELTEMIAAIIANPTGAVQFVESTMDQQDNEMVVQMLFSMFKSFVSTPMIRDLPGMDTLNDLLDGMNMGMAATGYIMHYKQITRAELKDYIYYSQLTSDGQLLRSNYHPLHLMTFMTPDEIPESFQKLFGDQDYLPNIVNIWDRGVEDSLIVITFQKATVHFDLPSVIAGFSDENIQSVQSMVSELFDSDTDSDSGSDSGSDSVD
jgi:hypothetical protein